MSIHNGLSRSTNYTAKIIFVGDEGVGKSSIMMRYTDDQYIDGVRPTIGIDFKIKTLTMNDRIYKVQIWDTAGHERFRAITPAYLRGAMGIILVYDISDINTFANIERWFSTIGCYAPDNAILVLVGNKCDTRARQISYNEGKQLAMQHNFDFFETSSKTGENIVSLFEHTVIRIKVKIIDQNILIKNSIPVQKNVPIGSNMMCCTKNCPKNCAIDHTFNHNDDYPPNNTKEKNCCTVS
jgi:small GTP-binding protein